MTVVGPAEAAAAEPTEVLVGADHDHALAHLAGLNPGHDGGGGAAVDDDVGFVVFGSE